MSRHRYVRNIDIDEELEEDILSDGGDDLSPEDYELLMDRVDLVRATLGSEDQSGISDHEVKDTLLYYNYAVEQSVNWLLEEQARKNAAKERKELDKPLPPCPDEDNRHGDQLLIYTHGNNRSPDQANTPPARSMHIQPRGELHLEDPSVQPLSPIAVGSDALGTPLSVPSSLTRVAKTTPAQIYSQEYVSGRQNVPLIRLAQNQVTDDEDEYSESRSTEMKSPLSTITEKTEPSHESRSMTSASREPSSRTSMISTSTAEMTASSTTDYGQPIGPDVTVLDSALSRSTYWQSAASPTPPESHSSASSVRSPSRSLPPMDTIPDIPSLHTKKSTLRPSSEKKSKLSALASFRSSAKSSAKSNASASSYSEDSRSWVSDNDTVVTYPHLRPSPASIISAYDATSESSHIRRAVDFAIQQQAQDRAEAQRRQDPSEPPVTAFAAQLRVASPPAPAPLPRSTSPPPAPSRSTAPASHVSSSALPPLPPLPPHTATPESSSTSQQRLATPPSSSIGFQNSARSQPSPIPQVVRLSTVAPSEASREKFPQSDVVQAAESSGPAEVRAAVTPAPEVVRVASPVTQARQPSKLARLAQAKAYQGHWMPKVQKPSVGAPNTTLLLNQRHTEYLTPTANGPTATTAITTSYQTLGSLLMPAQSVLPPSMLPEVRNVPPSSPKSGHAASKQSKLAMKSRNAQRRAEAEPALEESPPMVEEPLFSSGATRTRASPSAFASLLVDDTVLTSHEDMIGNSRGGHRDPGSASPNPVSLERENQRVHRKRGSPLPSTSLISSQKGFAFDSPSPDDIVFNARRGTSLAQRAAAPASPRSNNSSLRRSATTAAR